MTKCHINQFAIFTKNIYEICRNMTQCHMGRESNMIKCHKRK